MLLPNDLITIYTNNTNIINSDPYIIYLIGFCEFIKEYTKTSGASIKMRITYKPPINNKTLLLKLELYTSEHFN